MREVERRIGWMLSTFKVDGVYIVTPHFSLNERDGEWGRHSPVLKVDGVVMIIPLLSK